MFYRSTRVSVENKLIYNGLFHYNYPRLDYGTLYLFGLEVQKVNYVMTGYSLKRAGIKTRIKVSNVDSVWTEISKKEAREFWDKQIKNGFEMLSEERLPRETVLYGFDKWTKNNEKERVL